MPMGVSYGYYDSSIFIQIYFEAALPVVSPVAIDSILGPPYIFALAIRGFLEYVIYISSILAWSPKNGPTSTTLGMGLLQPRSTSTGMTIRISAGAESRSAGSRYHIGIYAGSLDQEHWS
jgi:hypothetical protein